jgi:AAA family ATP:ADP antiporter
VGAIVGGLTAGRLATPLGTETLLLFAAGTLVPAGILSAVAYHVAGEPKPTEEERKARKGQLALGLFLRNRTLLYLALLVASTQAVSTVLDLRFSMLLEEAIPLKDKRTAFLGTFWGGLNGITFFLQFVLTPLLLRLCPLRLVHAAIPLVHLTACAALLAHPTLFTSALAFLLFKSLDYSAFRAGKEILYIPLSFEARYRAKQVIDAFGYRASKGIMSGLLAAAGRLFGRLPGATYPILAIGSAVAWLFFVMRLTAKPSQESR